MNYLKSNRMLIAFVIVINFCCCTNIWATTTVGTERLKAIVSQYQTFQAHFYQRTYDSKGSLSQTSEGLVYLARPGMFRWEVKRPNQQVIIANGNTLWTYDIALAQATQRTLNNRGGLNPVALLTGNFANVARRFSISLQDKKHREITFELTPKTQGGSFKSISMMFRKNLLQRIRVVNELGQTSIFWFSKIKLNSKIDKQLFEFKPPRGVDILKA